jgi:hypothetical protein
VLGRKIGDETGCLDLSIADGDAHGAVRSSESELGLELDIVGFDACTLVQLVCVGLDDDSVELEQFPIALAAG